MAVDGLRMATECPEPFELFGVSRTLRTVRPNTRQSHYGPGMEPPAPVTPPAAVRRGTAGEDELYLDEILALTPIKRTRLYTFRDKGRFGPVREAPGPTCPRPVFLLERVAAVCEELGYPVPTVADVLAHRSADEAVSRTVSTIRNEAGFEEPAIRAPSADQPPGTGQPAAGVRRDPVPQAAAVEQPWVPARPTEHRWELPEDDGRLRQLENDLRQMAIDSALHEERADRLGGEQEALRAERDRARSEETAGRERTISLEADLRITNASRERALEDLVARDSRIRRLESDLEERSAEAHRLNAEHRGVQGELRQVRADRDTARDERNDIRTERDALGDDVVREREEKTALRHEVELLRVNTTRGFRRRRRRQSKRDAKAQPVDGTIDDESSDDESD